MQKSNALSRRERASQLIFAARTGIPKHEQIAYDLADALHAAHAREDAIRARVAAFHKGHDALECIRKSVLAVLDGDA